MDHIAVDRMSDKLTKAVYPYKCKEKPTHVSCVYPYGKFNIGFEDLDAIFDTYSKLCMGSEFVSGLAEMPKKYSMLTVDVDLKVKGNVPTPLHTEDDIKRIGGIYQEVIKSKVHDVTPEMLNFSVLIKAPYCTNKGDVKHGFHLQFHNLFIYNVLRNVYMFPMIKRLVSESEGLFELARLSKPENAIDFETGKSDRPWLMYSGCKSLKTGSYKLSHCYDEHLNRMEPDDAFSGYRVYKARTSEKITITPENLEKNLPRIFSVNPENRPISKLKEIRHLEKINFNGNMIQDNYNSDDEDEEENDQDVDDVKRKHAIEGLLKECDILLDMFNDERAEDWAKWMEVGYILYSISEGEGIGLKRWIGFSQRCERLFNEQRCVAEWSRMRLTGNYTIGSIKRLAKIDNSEAYAKYIREIQSRLAENVLSKTVVKGTHHDLAVMLYEKFGDEFVCADIINHRKNGWYQFKEHRWQITATGVDLRNKIYDFLTPKFEKIKFDILSRRAGLDEMNPDNKVEASSLTAKLRFVSNLLDSLGQSPFKKQIMDECADVFYDPHFLKKLGKNRKILCCTNGVIDMETLRFRPGRPSDYMFITTSCEFRKYNDADPEMIELYEFLNKVFVDESMRNYFLDVACRLLIGGNTEKNCYMLIGNGDNAKSILFALLQEVFGEYACKIPTTVLTGSKPAAGRPIPELSRIGMGVRLVGADEPEDGAEFNPGTYKLLTGGDAFYVRGLFQEGGEQTPMYRLFCICNFLPKLPADDNAVWTRAKPLKLESKFVEDAPADIYEQYKTQTFPIDTEFKDKLPDMAGPLLYILFNRLKDIITNGRRLVTPPKVLETIKEYRRSNDVFTHFFEKCIRIDEKANPDDWLDAYGFYSEFKIWHREIRPDARVPDLDKANRYLSVNCVKLLNKDTGKYIGMRLKSLDDDLADGNAVLLDSTKLANYDQEPDNEDDQDEEVLNKKGEGEKIEGEKIVSKKSKKGVSKKGVSKKSKKVSAGNKTKKQSADDKKPDISKETRTKILDRLSLKTG